jgi:hypothetical protein
MPNSVPHPHRPAPQPRLQVRPLLEGQVAEVSASLESLRRQHVAALDTLTQERDAALLKVGQVLGGGGSAYCRIHVKACGA